LLNVVSSRFLLVERIKSLVRGVLKSRLAIGVMADSLDREEPVPMLFRGELSVAVVLQLVRHSIAQNGKRHFTKPMVTSCSEVM
jgi:hypothetical protein